MTTLTDALAAVAAMDAALAAGTNDEDSRSERRHARENAGAACIAYIRTLATQQGEAVAWKVERDEAAEVGDGVHCSMIDAMVSRFLSWRLPQDFAPDAGISFTHYTDPAWTHDNWPIGTNLFTAPQSKAMLEHICQPLFDELESCESKRDDAAEAFSRELATLATLRRLTSALAHKEDGE